MRRHHPSPRVLASTYLLVCLMLWSARAQGGFAAEQDLWRGLDCLEAGRPGQALVFLGPLVDGPAKARPEVMFWAAKAALGAGEPNRALALLTPLVLPLAPLGDEVQALRAQALTALGRPAEATRAWQSVLRDWPYGPLAKQATFALPHTLLASGYGRGAEAAWRRALKRYPQAPEAAAARLAWADAVALRAGALAAVPSLRALLGSHEDAVAEGARARLARLRAQGLLAAADLRERLAWVDRLLAHRKLEDARAELAALQQTPGQAAAVGHQGAAEAASKRALATALVALRTAQLTRRQDGLAAAIPLWQQLVQGAPPAVGQAALGAWADALLASDAPERALPLYDALAAGAPSGKQRDAQFNAGLALYLGHQDAAARTRFARFRARYPHDKRADEALWYLAWAALRSGEDSLAERELAHLQARYPHSELAQRAAYWRGHLALRRGDNARAEQFWRQASHDRSGYYGLLVRQRRAQQLGSAPQANAGRPRAGVPRASPSTSAAPQPDDAATRDRQNGAADGPFKVLGDGLAWRTPAGWRTAWLVRLGLLPQAAATAHGLPPKAPPHGEGATEALVTDRARLLCAYGDYLGAMQVGMQLRRHVDGWPEETPSLPQAKAKAKRAALQLAFPLAYARYVTPAAEDFGVSPALVWAIMRQESHFTPNAMSTSMAHGLMQVLPVTARRIAARTGKKDGDVAQSLGDLTDDAAIFAPRTNVRLGAWYLAALLKNYDQQVVAAIGAYNAGPAAMDRWLAKNQGVALDMFVENVPFRETRQYIKHVLVNLDAYQHLVTEQALRLPKVLQGQSSHFVDF